MPQKHTLNITTTPRQRKADKWEALKSENDSGKASWTWAGADDLLEAVAAVTADGAALLLSRTSDGGALVLQVWNGDGRHKLYPATVSELNEALRLIKDIASQ